MTIYITRLNDTFIFEDCMKSEGENMLDKFLCKHIQKKTIRLSDIALLVGPYCLLGAFSLIIMIPFGGIMYEAWGYDPTISTTEYILNCIAIGILMCMVILAGIVIFEIILGMEVAHCPIKDDDEMEDD